MIDAQFRFNQCNSFREEYISVFSPIWSCVNTMTCGGSHLGFPIGITNRNFVEDLPMIMGKCSNAFFSETTNIIKAKLYMNVHWMVLYKLYVFCSDMKFKMAATAGLSLTVNLCPAVAAILDLRSA
jgi:hypothetical protein